MRFVVAVAEERNFTRAAMRCNISQPALSRRVSEVESALGTKLFERRTRSVRITRAGHLFVREARRTLEQSRRAVSLVRAFVKSHEAPVSLGFSALADPATLRSLIEQSVRTVAGMSLATHSANTPELMRDLLRSDVDLAIVDLPIRARSIRLAPLFTEPLIAALPEKLTSPKMAAVDLAELLKFPLTLLADSSDPARTLIEQHLSFVGTRAFRIHDCASVHELLDAVALDGRVGLIRQSASRFQREGVLYKLLSKPIQVGSALAWCADDRRPKLLSFRSALIAFSRQS